MEIGIVGLGRMGANIARRLMRAGHHCVVYDHDPAPGKALADEGAEPATSLEDLTSRLKERPRAVWSMLPAGDPTEATITALSSLLGAGDIVIDGGNSFYKDDIRRAKTLSEHKIDYVDCGTSGRRLGARARVLHDDRRREGCGRSPRSHFQLPGAWVHRHPADAGPRRPGSARGARLSPHRSCRLGALCQNDPQRHRIRSDAGLRGRL